MIDKKDMDKTHKYDVKLEKVIKIERILGVEFDKEIAPQLFDKGGKFIGKKSEEFEEFVYDKLDGEKDDFWDIDLLETQDCDIKGVEKAK